MAVVGGSLHSGRAVSGARISGIGAYRPERVVTNEEITRHVSLTPEWIESRTGVVTRRHASPGESVPVMGAAAAAGALAEAGVTASEIDLVIVATSSTRLPIPGLGPQTAALIGCARAGAFDVSAVCAGFTYAVSVGAEFVRGGAALHALVIGADRLSDWLDPSVPDTYAIFGDGAGAVVISQAPVEGIGPVVWGHDGSRHRHIQIQESTSVLEMNGPIVYKWAVATMPDVSREACAVAGVELEAIDYLVYHQANSRILDTLAAELNFPPERVARDVADSGNTSAASIPLALDALRANGRARSDELVLLAGFGAGLTYAALVARMP
jgi:3-oxoacyl-[acyl-carrier-protein] synthase-3